MTTNPQDYDFVIVGGGSAGAIVATRLGLPHGKLLGRLQRDQRLGPRASAGPCARGLVSVPGVLLDYPSRRQQPAALSALIDTLRLQSDGRG